MSTIISIRHAGPSDFNVLKALIPASANKRGLQQRILDQAVLMAIQGDRVLATAGIDLDRMQIRGVYVDPDQLPGDAGRRLNTEVERLAVQFGILKLSIDRTEPLIELFHACGYREPGEQDSADKTDVSGERNLLYRTFPRRQTRYSRKISQILASLEINPDYGRTHRMPLQKEASKLVSIGLDMYGREQQMIPSAERAWRSMSQQAAGEEIQVQAVSAFRSVDYQLGILQRKLERGQTIKEILRVSAAPGFSQHHTGRAIDVATPGFGVLEEDFEDSPAFEWLKNYARDFGFRMSFPRNNRHYVAYEPWHWAWQP